MLIAFIHSAHSFLPEISAYTDYFIARGFSCEVIKSEELDKVKPNVAWFFMGTDRISKPTGTITIHEYTSASVPPLAGIKNTAKKWLNSKPDYRLFLNEYVKNEFDFRDGVPFGYRDMGVPQQWLDKPEKSTVWEYDFIYVGEWKNRDIHRLLDAFAETLKDRSLLFISKDYEALQSKYPRINFKGPISHPEIASYIRRSRFGINYMPDVIPFNQQTSTKLLEYSACGLPVITSDYKWVRRFQQQFGGQYFYLNNDLSNLNWEQISHYNYSFPDLSAWTWEKQIEGSGIMKFLQQLVS